MSTTNSDREQAAQALRAGWLRANWPTLLIGGVTLAGALIIGNTLRDHETRALETAIETASRAVLTEVEHGMLDQMRALERLAANWERRKGLPLTEFEAEAGILVRDFANLQAVEWVDPGFYVRWIVPLAGNEKASGFNLGLEARRREALETSRDERRSIISRPIELVQGGLGLIVYVPLTVAGRFDGFVVGVWRAENLFSGLLRNVAPGFGIRIFDDGEFLYASKAPDTVWREDRVARVHSDLRPWSIEVAPLPSVIGTYQTRTPLFVAFGVAAIALGLTLATYVAHARRIQYQILAAEIKRRESAERRLSNVIEELPDHVWSGEITPEGFETTYYSPVIARITGYPASTFKDSIEEWFKIVHGADRETLQRTHAELLNGQRTSFEIEYRIRRADGALCWVLDRVHSTATERGTRLDGVTSDITEMKRIDAERSRSQEERLLLVERERMTREMHDGLGAQLVSTIAMLERGQSNPGEVAEALRRALDEMRILIDSLDPSTTDLSTSLGKLRARLEPLLRRNGMELRWQIEDFPGLDDYSPDRSLHFLRIIQEAVTNAMVHAKASVVCVDIRAVDAGGDVMSLEIRDNGRGFRPHAVAYGRGNRSMKSRTEALGGELRIDGLDPGTRVELRVAIPR
jgi:PAS domain S-box-containing protein